MSSGGIFCCRVHNVASRLLPTAPACDRTRKRVRRSPTPEALAFAKSSPPSRKRCDDEGRRCQETLRHTAQPVRAGVVAFRKRLSVNNALAVGVERTCDCCQTLTVRGPFFFKLVFCFISFLSTPLTLQCLHCFVVEMSHFDWWWWCRVLYKTTMTRTNVSLPRPPSATEHNDTCQSLLNQTAFQFHSHCAGPLSRKGRSTPSQPLQRVKGRIQPLTLRTVKRRLTIRVLGCVCRRCCFAVAAAAAASDMPLPIASTSWGRQKKRAIPLLNSALNLSNEF